ncbi:hypothetical protein [Streptomyces sp. NRRL WC-3618]|uniref:hypothetical protein n=1 Tax=Streptomyces sp. NRRL WC-3618 TaxID=1519490 RepID=UPI0006AF04F2|nr:hypothetical protein [Streptomyces sp. NRRL WC-3618]
MSTTVTRPNPTPAAPTTAPARRAFPVPRTVRSLRRAAPALLAYTAVRATGLLVLSVWAHRKHHGVWPILATRWDAEWYLGIADHGYPHALGSVSDSGSLAFFPLYPTLVKALAVLTPGTRASTGLGLAVAASLVAAWGVFAVGERLYDRRTGVVLAALWAAFPVGAVQWMGYTESLFTALAAWSLYAVLTGRWLWAASLAVLAGLTRPTGVAVAAAVSLTALLTFLRADRSPRVLTAVVVAPLGWLGYVGWVGLRLGRWDGYLAVQRLWRQDMDGGALTLRRMRELLMHDSTPELFLVLVTAVLLGAAVLFVLSAWDRQPLPLLIFTGVLLTIVLGSGGVYYPRARFLVPAFPLLLPLAVHLTRASRRFRVIALTTAVALSAYCGAYMALVWPSAP